MTKSRHGSEHRKRKKIQKDQLKELDEEDQRLTSALFQTGSSLWQHDVDDDAGKIERTDDQAADPFQIDRDGDTINEEESDDDPAGRVGDGNQQAMISQQPAAAAWVDEDDVDVNLTQRNDRVRKLRKTMDETTVSATVYEQRLRERFQATTQTSAHTDWARLDKAGDDDSADDAETSQTNALVSAGPLLAAKRRLVPNILDLKRCSDLNLDEPSGAVVQSVHFHPGSDPSKPIALTAGLDKKIRFFQVTEEKSEKIHSIHFPTLPISSAWFLGTTGTVVASGRRSFFYLYDSVAGKMDRIPKLAGRNERSLENCYASPDGSTVAFEGNEGFVLLFDVKQKYLKATLKLNGSVRSICFSGDHELLASGCDGDVYRFDLRTRRCVDRFGNQDGGKTSYLATSDRHMAVGAYSGVVNLYPDTPSSTEPMMSSSTPRAPIKSLFNLRTAINHARFNCDGNLLAISSHMERNSLRLVHTPTATVFSNWPTSKTPLGYVSSVDFSPESRFVAIGNDKGKCILYKLNHYSDEQ